MSKRKVSFEGGDVDSDMTFEKLAAKADKTGPSKPDRPTRFKDKHSLDSDEEDNTDAYNVMDNEEIEGNTNTI